MKIFVEADSIAYEKMSGIGHATLEILRALDVKLDTDRSLNVTAIIPRNTRPIVDRYNLKNIRIKEMPIAQKYINYVLTRTPLPLPIDLWFGRGVYVFPNYKTWYTPFSRSIMFVHDVAFKIFPDMTNPKNLMYLEANFDRWLSRASAVATITNASATDIREYFPEVAKKLHVIYLGVSKAQYYRRPKPEISAAQKKYSLPNNYFLFVGNLEPRKNIYNLLCAYEAYAANEKNKLPLVLIGGDGWQNKNIINKIESMVSQGMQVVRPDAYVADEDLPALYSGAQSVVHWAVHEGFGLPPLQAQACGTHVIASNIPALKEILDPKTTTFIDPADIPGMTKSLTRAQSISTANESIKNDISYTWTDTAQGVIDLSAMVR